MSNETRRILLVEDEKAIRDAVTAYLERENYWVTAVGDGQEALEEFSKHHFDLVILDLMLPRVPGERVCRAIRDNSDVPIIMLTAKGEVEAVSYTHLDVYKRQRLGLGPVELVELGRGHQRPCGRTCERLRILNHVRCGDEVLPAELRPLVQRDAGPDADDLNVSPAAGPAKLFSASEPMMPACL